MQYSRRYGTPLLVLALVVVVIVSFRAFLLANLVQPIALLIWAAWRVVASVDQQVYWGLVIAVGFILMGQLLVPRSRHASRSAYAHDGLPTTRFDHWRRLIDEAADGLTERERLRRAMVDLLQAISDEKNSPEINVLDERRWEPRRPPPKVVLEHLYPKANQVDQPILEFVPRWVRRRIGKIRQREDTWIKETIAWMESELDIEHGD